MGREARNESMEKFSALSITKGVFSEWAICLVCGKTEKEDSEIGCLSAHFDEKAQGERVQALFAKAGSEVRFNYDDTKPKMNYLYVGACREHALRLVYLKSATEYEDGKISLAMIRSAKRGKIMTFRFAGKAFDGYRELSLDPVEKEFVDISADAAIEKAKKMFELYFRRWEYMCRNNSDFHVSATLSMAEPVWTARFVHERAAQAAEPDTVIKGSPAMPAVEAHIAETKMI